MGSDPQSVEALTRVIERLKWRISTLETAELECVRAVNALQASEARFRRLLDDAGFPLTISTTTDSTILFANPLACRLFGLDGPNPNGRKMLEFYPDAATRSDLVAFLASTGTVRDWEAVLLDGRGQPRTLIVSASLITFDGQEAVLATSNDITERRQTEALFRTLVESSPDGFGIIGMDQHLSYVSPRLLEFFGYAQPEAMLGRHLGEFIPPAFHGKADERLKAILRGDYQGPSEWEGIRADGSTFPLEINGEVLRNPDGSPHIFFCIVRDLRNRKRMERSMRWAEKLESLGLMAGGIAHELNNAFQVTQGHLEEAEAEGELEPALREILGKVGQGVARATSLAREMLDNSGRNPRNEATFGLNALADEGLAVWRECLPSNVELVLAQGMGLPRMLGDEGQIRKVLSALVLNAVEAMEGAPGKVVVTTECLTITSESLGEGFWPAPGRPGTFLALVVQDQGPGIPPDRMERVCDPFFTTKGHGRGLGLSAALGIIRAHSACLQILSGPGRGTTFRACFPVGTAEPAPLGHFPAKRVAATGILLVEDDDTFRDLLLRMLRKWGYSPIWDARDGADALVCFQTHQESIALCLTDATMPRMSGPEAFEAMRKLSPDLIGVLMTGYSEAFGKATAASFGFSGFLNKPFSLSALMTKLESVFPRNPEA